MEKRRKEEEAAKRDDLVTSPLLTAPNIRIQQAICHLRRALDVMKSQRASYEGHARAHLGHYHWTRALFLASAQCGWTGKEGEREGKVK